MKTPNKSKGRKQKYATLKQALEPRVLFDASLVPAPPHDAGVTTDSSSPDSPQDIPKTAVAEPTDKSAPVAKSADGSTDKAASGPTVKTQEGSKDATNIRSGETDQFIDAQKLAVADVPAKELVFIDSKVLNPETLLAGISANASVHFIDAGQDGIDQIDSVIKAEKSPIKTIHILSHGESGSLTLGNSILNQETLSENYASEIASWRSHLTEDASVLLYGCDVAKGSLGQQFVSEISKDIGASVAASMDYTGSALRAGNWTLEFQTGTIGASITDVFSQQSLANYDYLMGQSVVDLNGPTVLSLTDNLSTGTYTGGTSNATTTWSGGWVEFDGSTTRAFNPAGSTTSDNSPTGGNIIIPSVATGGTVAGLGTGQEIALVGHTQQYGDFIERAVNLDAYTSASLSFSYRTAGLTSADAIDVNISKDGGATFFSLGTLANVTANRNTSIDISNYISDSTIIRFSVNRGFDGSSAQQFLFDNVGITANGNNYVSTFSEQTGASIPIADSAMTINQPNGLLISSAHVSLTNMKAGDIFSIGAIPATINATINNVNGIVTLQAVSGLGASTADFTTAIKAIRYDNTSAAPDLTTRAIDITVTDVSSLMSAPVTSYINVVSYDVSAVTVSHAITATALGTTSGTLFDNSSVGAEQAVSATMDYDPDTAGLSASLLSQATKGTAVVNADGTYTYTPNAGVTGTDSFTYTLTSKAQIPGSNYQEWTMDTSNTSLLSSFPTGTPDHTGVSTDLNVDQVSIDSGNMTLDNYVVRFSNTISVTTAGTYTFYTGSENGSVLYIDGELVVNNDGMHSFAEKSGSIVLSAGLHTLQIDFMKNGGQEGLYASYVGPDTSAVKTDLSGIGLASTTTTGTVNVTLQSAGPLLALGSNVNAVDSFSTAAYTNNNGTFNFTTSAGVAAPWVESVDSGGATGGQILVTGGKLQIADTSTGGSTRSISREIDLLALSGADPSRVGYQLSFNYDTPAASTGVFVQISSNGGSSWTTLDTISAASATSSTSRSYDISSYASSNVVLRFLPTAASGVAIVNFDNVRIDASSVAYTAANFIENGAPVAIASSGAVIADSTTSNISSAIIKISNFQSGDTLAYDNFVSGITASLSGDTLTLTGTASRANYAIALQHVLYSNTIDNPSTVNRTISVTVKDALNNFSNSANTTIGVTAANDAPVGIARTVSASLNTTYVLQASDFSFTDIEGNALQAVKIASVPASVGTLQFDTTGSGNWTAVTANQTITAANILAGRLRFLPTTDSSGPATFTFQVQDTGGTANSGADIDSTARNFTINVLVGPNTGPTLTRDLILASSAEDSFSPTSRSITQLLTDGGASAFSDPDSSAVMSGLAIVGNTANATTEGSWQYSTDGSTWFDVGTVGDNASALGLALSSSTQIRFVPVSSYEGTPTGLTVRAMDDAYAGSFTNGATRSSVNTGTHGGSSAISDSTRFINTSVSPVNDAPNLIVESPTLNTIIATQVNNAGQLVSDLVPGSVTDVENSTLGVAVVSAAGSNGTWEYSTDNGSTWASVGSVSENSSLLLRSTDKVRFNPDGVNAGMGAISYRAWDQTSGATGTKVDTTSNGGTTAFSVSTDVATITTTGSTAPVLANTSAPLVYIEKAAAGAIDTALTITDLGSATLTSAKVSITNFVLGQDVLSFTNNGTTMGNIAATYNSTTGILSLSSSGGTATLAQWQAALRAVKYSNLSDAPDATSRSVNFQVNDSAGAPSNVLTATLGITTVNDAPVGTSQSFSMPRSSVHVFTEADFGFTDPLDNSANHLLAVQITTLPASGTLTNNGVTVTLNSFVSVADINAGKLIYTAPSSNATRTILFKVQDDGGTANSGVNLDATANTLTFVVSGNNTAPTLTALTPTLTSITENDINNLGQAVSSFLGTVTDPNAGALKGIAITSLGTATNGTWQYSIDAGQTWTAFPTISASTSLLLGSTDSIRFVPNGIGGGGGTFTYRAWDQTSGRPGITASTSTTGGTTAFSSNSTTATIVSSAVNDAPTATMSATSYNATEQVNLTLSGTGMSIADIDAGTSTINATLSVGEGALTVAAGSTGVVVTGSGTSSVLLSGSLTQINNLLAGLNSGSIIYNDSKNAPAASTNVMLSVNDLGNTGTGGALNASVAKVINIAAINDAPTFTGTAGAAYTENSAAVSLVTGTINASDVDTSNFNGGTVTVAFSSYVTGDVLEVKNQGTGAGQIGVSGSNITYAGTSIGTFTGGDGANLIITLNSSASPTAVKALVAQLQYRSTSDNPTLGGGSPTRALTVTLNDGGNTGAGGALTASLTGTVTITAVNDAPLLSVTTLNPTFNEAATAVNVFSGANVNPVESGQAILEFKFTVSGLVDAANETIVVDGKTIALNLSSAGTTTNNGMVYTVSVVSGTATVSLSSAGITPSTLNTIINNISYQNTNVDNPTAGNRVFTITQMKDSGGVASGGVDTTNLGFVSAVTVVPVNDFPVLTGTSSINYTENAAATPINTSIVLSDVDSATLLNAKVSISNYVSGEDVLSFTANASTGNIVASFNTSTGVLTLSSPNNSGTPAQFQAALRAVSYANTSDNPSTVARDITFVADDGGSANNLSSVVHSAINITAVNDNPVLSGTSTIGYSENSAATLINTSIVLSDV
ncbi:MAG: DUF4347 domain-containing protein, partial [Gammaproteobacteria bacterium]